MPICRKQKLPEKQTRQLFLKIYLRFSEKSQQRIFFKKNNITFQQSAFKGQQRISLKGQTNPTTTTKVTSSPVALQEQVFVQNVRALHPEELLRS